MHSHPSFITYTFKGDIWRLLPDEATGLIGVEVRDVASLQVYFCLVNPKSPTLLLDHFQLPELWWTGLAGFNDQMMYLHGFERRGQLGQPKGLTAIELATQKAVFELPNAQWEGKRAGSILVSDVGLQPKALIEVNAFSGEILGAAETSEVLPLQESTGGRMICALRYPDIYEEGSAYFQDLATFLLKGRGQVAKGKIEYLELDSCFILSYYVVQENGLFVKFLVTYSLNGEALNEFCPLKDAEIMGGPPFFVQVDQLLLVKDKKSLLSVSLPVNVNID